MPDDKKGGLSTTHKAGSATQECPLEEKSLECDYDGLKLTFSDPSEVASCSESRSFRDMTAIIEKYASKDDNKFKKIFEYDTILEVAVPPLTTGQTKKFSYLAEPIIGQGPCDKHLGMDIRVKNMDSNDTLRSNKTNVTKFEPVFVYGKYTDADQGFAKVNGIMGLFWMFVDTSAEKYIKEADFTLKSCSSRTDGKKPNGPLTGLVRVYRDDSFSLTFNLKSRYQYGAGAKKESGGKSETYTKKAGTKFSSSYENEQLSGLKEESHGFARNSTYTLDENGNEVAPTGSTKFNEKIFTIKRNGHEIDASKIINKVLLIKDLVQDAVDIVKEIKDAIPKVGINGDVSLDFLFGSIEASWGLSKSADSTKEYVWVEPDFKGKIKLTLIQVEAKLIVGIETVSPAFLNWWGEPLWEFKLTISLGVNGSISISGQINVVSGSLESNGGVGFPENPVIPGCEYKGNGGKEKQVIVTEGVIKPVCEGIARVNIGGIFAEAKVSLKGAIKVSAAIVWPFDIRYKGVLEQGDVVFTYDAINKRPSKPDVMKVWDKNENLIKENYAFGGKV